MITKFLPPKMKVAFLIHHTSLKAGGIFTYSTGLLQLLIKSDEIEKIFLIISSAHIEYFRKILTSSKVEYYIIDRENLLINARFGISYILLILFSLFRKLLKRPDRVDFINKLILKINPYHIFLRSSQVDILHVPFQYAPIYSAVVPIIVTMHDIQELHYPEYFTRWQKLHRRVNNFVAINDSDHIIVSFDHVKSDLLKHFNISKEKISVCPPSFTDDWFLTKKFSTIENLFDKYKIDKEFLLYPAATWKHKNHRTLFKALDLLRREGITILLICTGYKTGYFDYLQKQISDLNLSSQVDFLGIIPEEDLIGLYKCTSLVVIPTKYEAGSGPLYEAMRYSVPVICSNVTSLPETIGNTDYIFNPDDEKEMATKIKRILQDENYKSENLANSSKRIEEMSKVDYTKNYIDVYRRLLRERNS